MKLLMTLAACLLVSAPLALADTPPGPPPLEKGETLRYTPWHKVGSKLARAIEYRQGDTVALCLQFSEYAYASFTPSTTYSVGECPRVYQRLPDGSFDPVMAMPTRVMSKIKRHSLATLADEGEIDYGIPGETLVLPEGAQAVHRSARLGER